MNAALAMHGPHANGIWLEGHVGLGHRLVRFTPEDYFECQPLAGRESRLYLVSDGRIDNRPELMEKLSIPASEARQMPDSAFILRSYEKWGADCPSRLVGAFTFALYNKGENSLLLARSPRGERTLVYHASAKLFAFATAPKGLFALPFVRRELNGERVADLLASAPPNPNATFFSGIEMLQQGHSLLVRLEGLKTGCYWRVNPNFEIRFLRDEDYVDAFHTLFDRVIGDQMRSITPVGVMMSGGLDSTSVAAIAAERLSARGARLAAFTETPQPDVRRPVLGRRYADETPYTMTMARRYSNLDLNLVRTDERFFLDDMERFLSAAEVPFRNAFNRTWWEAIQEQAAAQGIRVLLTGLNGNFTISWAGDGVLPTLIERGKWTRAFKEMRALAKSGSSPSIFHSIGRGLMPLLPEAVWLAVQRIHNRNEPAYFDDPPWRSYSPMRPEFARRHRVQERAREVGHRFRLRSPRNSRFGFLPTRDTGAEIACGHQAMFGVQTRDPANDQRIVEFCLAIPEDQYLRNGTSKWLIRRTMAARLPSEILSNRLRGLQASDWFERVVRFKPRIVEELNLLERSSLAIEALDLCRLRRLAENAPQEAQDTGTQRVRLRMLIEIGLTAGRFLRWVESGH